MDSISLLTDQDQFFRQIHQKLIAPFPKGSVVQKERDSESYYVPVQVYIARLNEAAGGFWSFRITNQIIHEKEGLIQVNGVLKILDYCEHEGIGFSNLQYFRDNKEKIRNLKIAAKSAASDALRDCCDQLQMGWVDLAPYREYAKNPGVGLFPSDVSQPAPPVSATTCVVCKEPLYEEDMKVLATYKIKLYYCQRHVPEHLTRKKS